ncbi:MAG TPA: hypothetical protein VE826_11635 [Dongiaceae bacterium]|nr:hypothetical protein [Dongiaceae bacterium]
MTYLDTLRLVRNVLLRTFAVGVVFALVMLVATLAAWPVWTGLAMSWFHADQAQLSSIVLAFFTAIRFFFLFVLLAPALALHWTLRSERARHVT